MLRSPSAVKMENDGCYFPLSHSILSIQIQSSSIDFFPLFKSLSLEGVKDDADARQLEALQSTVRMVLEKVGRARQRKGMGSWIEWGVE